MSPPNCNEILSPSKDGGDESERVSASEGDWECSGREAERTRSLPAAAVERAPGTAAQTPLSARLGGLGAAWQSRTLHAVGRFTSPEAVDPSLGTRQVSGLQRFSFDGKALRRGGSRLQPRDRAPHPARGQVGLSAKTSAAPVPFPPPAPPAFRHDGPHRCQSPRLAGRP